jgi:glucose/arabinose dehydrogenase
MATSISARAWRFAPGAHSHGRRDVVQAPDGSVYALTDEGDGMILRLTFENSPK